MEQIVVRIKDLFFLMFRKDDKILIYIPKSENRGKWRQRRNAILIQKVLGDVLKKYKVKILSADNCKEFAKIARKLLKCKIFKREILKMTIK